LEKKPELRYQQARALKTQVETLVGAATAGDPGSAANKPTLIAGIPLGTAALLCWFYCCYVLSLLMLSAHLPARLADHFDGDGHANGWISRSGYQLIMGMLPLSFIALFLLIGFLVRTLPETSINVPRRDFWLAPEHRGQLHALVLRRLAWLAWLLMIFFGILNWLVMRANDLNPPHLGGGSLITITIGIMLSIMIWLVSFVVRLSNPATEIAPVKNPAESRFGRRVRKFFLIQLPAALVILLVIRTFFLQPFRVETDSMSPEIPRGSQFLVWLLGRNFAPADIIAYSKEGHVNVGRVVRRENGAYTVNRNGSTDFSVPQNAILGKVVSIYWRASNAAGAKSDFSIGQAHFPEGDTIEITSVERTGDQMTVEGRYDLVSVDQATLALYLTSTNQSHSNEDAKQSMPITKGRGDFELTHYHLMPGLPHVSMYAQGHSFADLYFGNADEAETESKLDLTDPLLASQPPVVVETSPPSGARDVEPGETEIRVRFSKPMTDGSWSWSTAWENSTPDFIGSPHYEPDDKTCVAKAKLEPGRTYGFWLNSDNFQNFKDTGGRPAVPYQLIFQTKQN
jgi:signal peptidase I